MIERFDFYGMIIYLCLEATRDLIKSNNNLPRGVAMVMMFPRSAQFFRAVSKRAHHVLMTCHLLSAVEDSVVLPYLITEREHVTPVEKKKETFARAHSSKISELIVTPCHTSGSEEPGRVWYVCRGGFAERRTYSAEKA